MNEQLLREALVVLNDIRSELSGNAEDSVICQLDRAIQDLEVVERECSEEITPRDLLELLGKVLEKLPAILALIEFLRRLHG